MGSSSEIAANITTQSASRAGADHAVFQSIDREFQRQREQIELIASENIVSLSLIHI